MLDGLTVNQTNANTEHSVNQIALLLNTNLTCFLFIFTWDAQVDSRTRHSLAGQLVHRLYMITSGVRCSGCQDNQLIVQSNCSARNK